MARIIAIDPGKRHTGVVCACDGRIEVARTVTVTRNIIGLAKIIEQQIEALREIIYAWSSTHRLLVEVPMIREGSRYRHSDQMDLAFIAGALYGHFYEGYGLVVTPQMWNKGITKKITEQRVKQFFPELRTLVEVYPESEREHIYDAAGMIKFAREELSW